jgi:uncharacterized membrane protein
MSTSTPRTAFSPGSLLTKAAYLVLAILIIYFVFTRAIPYLDYSYSVKQYGGESPFIFTHVIFGITATIIGPFQFAAAIRKRNVRVHRTMGKIYLISTITAAIASWVVILSKDGNISYRSGLFFLGVAWITCGVMAYLAIRMQKVEIHREWMVRSYVVTLAFVTFRLVANVLDQYHIEGAGAMLAWGCWALPLLITEVVFQVPKIYGREEAVS